MSALMETVTAHCTSCGAGATSDRVVNVLRKDDGLDCEVAICDRCLAASHSEGDLEYAGSAIKCCACGGTADVISLSARGKAVGIHARQECIDQLGKASGKHQFPTKEVVLALSLVAIVVLAAILL